MKLISNNKKMQYIGVPIVVLMIALVLLLSFHFLTSRGPGGLDSNFEYIGKTTSGCYFLCDGLPSESYYFATSLDKEQLIKKNKASYVKPENIGTVGFASDYQYEVLNFSSPSRDFYITYYDKENSVSVRNTWSLSQSKYPYTIQVSDDFFSVVKESLR